MTELEKFQSIIARTLTVVTFVNVPVLAGVCALIGRNPEA